REPLYQSLAFDLIDLQTAYEEGQVTKKERDDLVRDWTATWDKEIQRCLLELHRRFIRLEPVEGNQEIAKGDGLKFPKDSPLVPLASLDPKGTIGPVEVGDGIASGIDSDVRMGLTESIENDRYIREAIKTRERMKTRWSILIDSVVHGVERVD
ncbi:MAG: hypothetical protein KDD43_06265, partial [Bdellovibrionales bacterium]|nr:hypothetical protein [Bdellovibrionales bacterium]